MPDPQIVVNFENESYQGIDLSEPEKQLLSDQLFGVLGAGSSLLHGLYQENLGRILGAAAVAKAYFQTPFKGLSAADSEFGFQPIRPYHVLRTTAATETPAGTWSFTFASGTAGGWLGYGSSNGTAINIDKRLLVLPLAIAFSQGSGPIVEELVLQVGSTTYPVVVIRQSWLADNVNQVRFVRIRPQIWIPKQTVLGQTNSIQGGVNQMVVLGVSFGRGDLLRTVAPSSVQT